MSRLEPACWITVVARDKGDECCSGHNRVTCSTVGRSAGQLVGLCPDGGASEDEPRSCAKIAVKRVFPITTDILFSSSLLVAKSWLEQQHVHRGRGGNAVHPTVGGGAG